jgi:hypothetical protein
LRIGCPRSESSEVCEDTVESEELFFPDSLSQLKRLLKIASSANMFVSDRRGRGTSEPRSRLSVLMHIFKFIVLVDL